MGTPLSMCTSTEYITSTLLCMHLVLLARNLLDIHMFRGNLDFVPLIVLCGPVELWLLALSIPCNFIYARSYVQHGLPCLCKVCINVWFCVGVFVTGDERLKWSIMMVAWNDSGF